MDMLRSKKIVYSLLNSFLISLTMAPLFAKETRWTHFGLRPLGMGNAYVAVADDYNALFYNPAGLARLEGWDGEFLNPAFEASNNTVSFLSELTKISGGSSGGTEEVLDTLKEQAGNIHRIAYYQTPHIVGRGWGFGVGLQLALSMITHATIDVEVDTGLRAIIPISFATNFLGDRLSLGASVKVVARAGVEENFNLDTISAFSSTDDANATKLEDLVQAGYGAGVDLGLLFTPIKPMKPTIGISVTDLGGTSFTKADLSGTAARAPNTRLASVNTGVSFIPFSTDIMYVRTSMDMHMINRPIHFSHKLNLGVEWGYSEIIKLQAGLKEGYLTGGLQFDVGLLNLRVVTYAVDHGPVVGEHDSFIERRMALQFKMLI